MCYFFRHSLCAGLADDGDLLLEEADAIESSLAAAVSSGCTFAAAVSPFLATYTDSVSSYVDYIGGCVALAEYKHCGD